MGNYNSPGDGRFNSSNVGLVVGLIAGAAYGYWRWGQTGLIGAVPGAIVGTMLETALIAGSAGRASLLLALVPLAVFGAIAYVVAKYFRGIL